MDALFLYENALSCPSHGGLWSAGTWPRQMAFQVEWLKSLLHTHDRMCKPVAVRRIEERRNHKYFTFRPVARFESGAQIVAVWPCPLFPWPFCFSTLGILMRSFRGRAFCSTCNSLFCSRLSQYSLLKGALILVWLVRRVAKMSPNLCTLLRNVTENAHWYVWIKKKILKKMLEPKQGTAA